MRQIKRSRWIPDRENLLVEETLFHNANGYIGVRGCLEEGYPDGYDTIRGTYINGFYDYVPMPQAEKLYGLVEEKQTILNVAEVQGIRLNLDGEWFSVFEGEILDSYRVLDMDKGITHRWISWKSPQGKVLEISIKRMASFTMLPLFLIEYEITSVNYNGKLAFYSMHSGKVSNYFNPDDPRVAGEAHVFLQVTDQESSSGFSSMTARTSKSGLSVTTAVRNVLAADSLPGHGRGGQEERVLETEEDGFTERITTYIAENESVRMTKYCIICDSTRYPGEEEAALALCREASEIPAEDWFGRQAAYLDKFWNNCDIGITGDHELTEALHYNMYQLLQSAGKDSRSSIAAKGLSGEGYEGHYFWDTEMYIMPFFLLNDPDTAVKLLRYRYHTLEHAKENARILGHKKGAAYSWRTIMGRECSGYFPSGSAQYHISGDIAYAVVAYYLASRDLGFMEEYGAEMLVETARLWMELGNYYEGTFQIHAVTGPDEYTCLVNNNYYTNVLARYNLEWAVKIIRILEEGGRAGKVIDKAGVTRAELQEFEKAAGAMYLPYDEKLGINPQDDSFLKKKKWDLSEIKEEEKPLLLHYHPMYLYRHQICKQADTVMAHFILEDAQDVEVIRRSFVYYETVTTHDSSLSSCIFSIVAAKLGMVEKAYEYFGESAKLDLFNTHKNTKDGIHTANMGGTYMAVVYGFGGLRTKESGLYLAPVLPKRWTGYYFQFQYQLRKIRVTVNARQTEIQLMEGTFLPLWVHGKLYQLTHRLIIDAAQG